MQDDQLICTSQTYPLWILRCQLRDGSLQAVYVLKLVEVHIRLLLASLVVVSLKRRHSRKARPRAYDRQRCIAIADEDHYQHLSWDLLLVVPGDVLLFHRLLPTRDP